MTILIRSIRRGFGLHPKYLKEVIGELTEDNICNDIPMKKEIKL